MNTNSKTSSYSKFLADEKRRIEALRHDKDKWIVLLESLLLDAEDIALTCGEWGLCDSMPRSEHPKDRYQSQTCSDVISNIRARTTGRHAA